MLTKNGDRDKRFRRPIVTPKVSAPEGGFLLPLSKGQSAILDEDDFDRFSVFKWSAQWCPCTRSHYVVRYSDGGVKGRHRIFLHRLVMDLSDDDPRQVDHRNHDTLDCRKENLRIATRSQNQMNRYKNLNNTSGFKGVSWHKRDSEWRSQVVFEGRRIWLGRYRTKEEAAHAYDVKARELFGEFAVLNFPDSV